MSDLKTKPLTEWDSSTLRALLDRLHADRERYDRANRIVEARACELEIAEMTRALAVVNRRSTEAEDQRVAEERVLTEERMREVVERVLIEEWKQPPAEADPVLVFIQRSAGRSAKELAGAAVSTEQRDRIVTIADEAFGLGPVETLDATLTRIERGIFEQHKRLINQEAQREADLREAVKYGMDWAVSNTLVTDSGCGATVDPPTDDARDLAAAEYARSKAGG